MQSKWVIGAAVSTLSIGVIGVSAAFAASSAHLNDQSGVTISAGVEGESITPISHPYDSMQRTGDAGSSDSKNQDAKDSDAKNQADDKTSQHNTNQQTQQHQPPAQTQQPKPEAPVVAPPPQPQSVSSISAESFD